MAKKQGFTHESTHNESVEYYTPLSIFKALGLEFDLDPCSPGADVVPWIPAKKHLTYLDDGFSSGWNGLVFMNPPYGMNTPYWMKKLARHGNGIALVFSRLETTWFHDFVVLADCVLFIRGRINFVPNWLVERYVSGECMAKDGRFRWPRGKMPIINGKQKKRSGSGNGSMLVAYGELAKTALMNCGLGAVFLPCAVSKQSEMNVSECGSGVIQAQASRCEPSAANENSPRYVEPAQGRLF